MRIPLHHAGSCPFFFPPMKEILNSPPQTPNCTAVCRSHGSTLFCLGFKVLSPSLILVTEWSFLLKSPVLPGSGNEPKMIANLGFKWDKARVKKQSLCPCWVEFSSQNDSSLLSLLSPELDVTAIWGCHDILWVVSKMAECGTQVI